ncbi:hypothetical protein KJ855_00395, partial [Patescibacteria group bacterium]|nr:hypothetical protein [Patescibacteria group bacterium]
LERQVTIEAPAQFGAKLRELRQAKQSVWVDGASVNAWVLEPKINYLSMAFSFDGKKEELETSLSVHVLRGKVPETISLQFIRGTAWGGNIICNREEWGRLLGMLDNKDGRVNPNLKERLEEGYDLVLEKMREYLRAVNQSERYKDQQVRGGWDVAIGSLGGKFGDRVMALWLDNNARANGCEPAYACEAKCTRNFVPEVDFRSFAMCLPGAIEAVNRKYNKDILINDVELVAVSAGWGQVAMRGAGAIETAESILLLEKVLSDMNLIKIEELASKLKVGLSLQDLLFADEGEMGVIGDLQRMAKQRMELYPKEPKREVMLNVLSYKILGMDLAEMKKRACRVFKSYRNNGEQKKNLLIVGGASPNSALQEIERQMLAEKGCVLDIPGGIETRDMSMSEESDVSLIATLAGLEMIERRRGKRVIDLANEVVCTRVAGEKIKGMDVYYKSDALLMLMLTNPESEVLLKLQYELKKNPLVCPYNLDEETQIALMWLADKNNMEIVDVDANSPEVSVELTRKGYRYPTVEEAARLEDCDDEELSDFEKVKKMQEREWELSPMAREINYHPDCMPGYAIARSDNYEDFYQKILLACKLMSRRYGLDELWVKPDRGTDGGNQGIISMGDGKFNKKIREMWKKKLVGAWVIEAKTKYFTIDFPVNGRVRKLKTAPSVHVLNGEPCKKVALQIDDESAWGGNMICTKETWDELIVMIDSNDERIINNPGLTEQLKNSYWDMEKLMSKYIGAVNGSDKYRNGQVRGGIDLALATLGGKFGDEIVIVFQDNNPRANGGESARALYRQAQIKYGNGQGEASTRIITPNKSLDDYLKILSDAMENVYLKYDRKIDPDEVELISYSEGVGIFGMKGRNALVNLEKVLLLEDELRRLEVIK